MCTKYVKERRELIQTLLKGRKFSDLPAITQVYVYMYIYIDYVRVYVCRSVGIIWDKTKFLTFMGLNIGL